MVAARRRAVDPNDEAQYGDRIPYVIMVGEPNTRLADRAVPPEDMFQKSVRHPDSKMGIDTRLFSRRQIDGVYYITQVLLPPLERVFNLVGADVRSWYDEMPRSFRVEQEDTVDLSPRKLKEVVDDKKSKIVDHFRSCSCLVCRSTTTEGEICTDL